MQGPVHKFILSLRRTAVRVKYLHGAVESVDKLQSVNSGDKFANLTRVRLQANHASLTLTDVEVKCTFIVITDQPPATSATSTWVTKSVVKAGVRGRKWA